MTRCNLSTMLLIGIGYVIFFIGDACRAGTAGDGWKASPELVTEVQKKRPYANFDEQKVPQYQLPDPLVAFDGTRVVDKDTWYKKRRPEILESFRSEVYGRSPVERPKDMKFDVFDVDRKALGGIATRKQVTVYFTGKKAGPAMDILIYLPNSTGTPVPIFLILNVGGNHAVQSDPAIKLSQSWMRPGPGVVHHRATEKSRGAASARFPIDMITRRGYGFATIYYGDIDPDFDDGFKNGVHPFFDKSGDGGRAPDAWGSIGAWAWGLSRAVDYFETDEDIDQKRVVVLGHSRRGKTALWAGAQDERFAIVISNESGCGGAALSRRRFGETVQRINTKYPYWFCENFKKYNDKEDTLPVDQHMLIALIAPRPVYVASADGDLWSDPRGEFLACKNADPVYHLLGKEGLGSEQMPELDRPIQKGMIGYHVRSGSHNLTQYDWAQYINFADRQFGTRDLR